MRSTRRISALILTTESSDFVEIPEGWFSLPVGIKNGYDIDSVFVPSFYIAKKNVSTLDFDCISNSFYSAIDRTDNNGFVDGLNVQSVLAFIKRLNLKSNDNYRIPSDVEWMRAYQYVAEKGMEGDFFDGPEEMCYWINPQVISIGDTLRTDWWNEEIEVSKGDFISKGKFQNLYNRDMSFAKCGIRLVLVE